MRKRTFLRRLRRMLEDHADTLALMRAADTVDWEKAAPLDEVKLDGEVERDSSTFRIYTTPSTSSVTVVCTCPDNRGDNHDGSCVIHDVRAWSKVRVWAT